MNKTHLVQIPNRQIKRVGNDVADNQLESPLSRLISSKSQIESEEIRRAGRSASEREVG